jgi:glutamine amidotransferase
MDELRRLDLVGPIKDFIEIGKPFMGICLGLQLLMSESEEFGRHEGLDVIRGSVVRFPNTGREGQKIKVPQVGWNRIFPPESSAPRYWKESQLKGIASNTYMYFVHSFYAVPTENEVILSRTNYQGTEYVSSVFRDNVFACQFHPEKSGNEGLRIYSNWAAMIKTKRNVNHG